MNEHTTENPSQKLIRKSASIGLVEKARSKQSFYGERETFLQHYGCRSPAEGGSVVGCLAEAKISQKDRKYLEKSGFKRCRPFLEACDKSDRLNALKRLHTELSKKNERGMAYICWKAAAQGAQCCINPDQCPTDGAFRSIAGQLKKSAPGLIRQYAGFKSITGQNQTACRANLLANASGPLAGLRTKTCGDAASACKETCDGSVQNFIYAFLATRPPAASPASRTQF